ncbi:MAG: glycine oxidase ThiO [Actinomycetes bacterium]
MGDRSCDAVFVGGGPIGLASAWRAGQRGLDVLVLERDHAGAGAADVAAGWLAPITETHFDEHDDQLQRRLEACAAYPGFVAELAQETAVDPGYHPCGTLAVALDRDDVESLRREYDFLRALDLDVEWLLPSEARALEPALSPRVAGALHAPSEAAVDPRRLCRALAAAVGDRLVEGAAVTDLLRDGDRVTGVRTAVGDCVHADTVVVTTGAWSGSWLPPELAPPVRPVKGQVLVLGGAEPCTRALRTSGIYIVPRGDGRLVLGATVEERGFDTTVTAGGVHELLREAYRVLPEIAELELLEARASLRPGSPDNSPIIGPGPVPGLVYATGHYRNGILLTPTTADEVAALLAGVHA